MNNLSYFSFKASIRKKIGRNANIKLKKANKIPGVIYCFDYFKSIYLDKIDIKKLVEKIGSGNNIFECVLDDVKFLVIVKEIQYHPYKDEIMNIDFQKINLDSVVKINVMLNFTGLDKSFGIKNGGIFVKHKSFFLIKGKVMDLPNYIDIDLSNLQLNQSIFLKDLNLNSKYEIVGATRSNFLIASILGSRVLDEKKEKESVDVKK